MEITAIITGLVVPVARSVLGWAENALADKKVTAFEWAKLGETIIRVGVMQLAILFGMSEYGMEPSVVGAAAGALLLDFILSAMKKKSAKVQ